MLKKRIAVILLLIIIPFSLFSNELEKGFDAIYDGLYASVASYFSVPRTSIDGISFEYDVSGTQVKKIAFNRVDLSKVLFQLKREDKSLTWYQRIVEAASSSLSPIMKIAIESLSQKGYDTSDVILDGSVTLRYNDYYPFKSLLDLFVKNDWSDLLFYFDLSMIASGNSFSVPLIFNGEFSVKGGQNQKIEINCIELKINNIIYEVTPFIFSN